MSRNRVQAPQARELSGRERLTQALAGRTGVPLDLAWKVQSGWYDEFGPSDVPGPVLPIVQLVRDLRAAGLNDMAKLAEAGAYDAARWESDAWAASPEGKRTLREADDPAMKPLLERAARSPEIMRNRPMKPKGRG